jgi:DNA-binding IclR family transcriptional regulator
MQPSLAASCEAAIGEIVDNADSANDTGERDPSPLKHRMIARVASILEMVAREPEGLSLTNIARQAEAPVSSVQGLVNGLVETGYLDRSDKRYFLGPAPYVLNLIAQRPPIQIVRHTDLEELHHETGRTVVLGIMLTGKVIYIDHVTSDPTFAFLAETHAPRPLLRTAVGRVLLANMDRRQQFEHLRSGGVDDGALIDAFLHESAGIRESDLAQTRGLVGPGYWTVATAVRERGRVVAALALSGPPAEMRDRMDELGGLLLQRMRGWKARNDRS